MNNKEIIENLQSGLYDIEYGVNKEDILIGALMEKTNSSGLGRFEFAVSGIEEQKRFLEDVNKYFLDTLK
ncbi:hypothetical protein LGK95_21060 [Clostridium algoriphilum]|uniref:hypothetical protein n=1 Tax=Clostridium algoriphilum TaxID=198347 RepID=UPI001CF46B79|nr:hypothetical protein [Clostridium algoriphilum]MCB2295953.1 hypothetical protein [Clostridium algoriphilum]